MTGIAHIRALVRTLCRDLPVENRAPRRNAAQAGLLDANRTAKVAVLRLQGATTRTE